MNSPTLFLFDLDGTLISTGGAGMRALGSTFKELYGLDNPQRHINPSGKTDPAIFREIVELALKRPATDEELERISERYLTHLESQMKIGGAKKLKGVEAFLRVVSDRPHSFVGLGTGNLEKGARLKLAPVALNEFFTFGGFGSDAEDRAELLRHGHRRAEAKAGRMIDPSSTFVIGDTPLDVSAARRAGFNVVAVASGSYSMETLGAAQPDFLLRDLDEGDSFLERIDTQVPEVS